MNEAERNQIKEKVQSMAGVTDRALCAQFGRECARDIVPQLLDELERLTLITGGEDLGSKLVTALEEQILSQPGIPEDVVLHHNVQTRGISATMVPGQRAVNVQVNLTLGAPPR